MTHPNLLLRDPVMYRIRRAHHYRRGDAWCLYPTYDWAHGQSDSIEGITHSICTLEFEVHRPLYDWFLDRARHPPSPADRVRPSLPQPHPAQQAQAPGPGQGGGRGRLGRSAHADHLGHAPAGLPAGGPAAASPSWSAWPRSTASSSWPSSRAASAKSSTGPRPGPWPSCGRSRSS